MNVIEIITISIALAMDAFAVAVCKGLAMNMMTLRNTLIVAFYFSFFQMLMPTIGYTLGNSFNILIMSIDHWLAFILLMGIGVSMLVESFNHSGKKINDKVDFKTMVVLAIATSIDALAVGITFSFLQVNLFLALLMIGIITFVLSLIGVILGNKFGNKHKQKAEMLGGIILIIMAFKILLEHLF